MSQKNQPSSAAAAYDIQLLFPVLFLVGIGIVMVYSASSAVALKKFGSDYLFLKKQALFAFIGIVALVACRHFPYRWYRPLTYPMLAVALALLIAIQITDFGSSAGGAARWLRIGSLTFQPSEFARLALVVFMAYSLDKKNEKIKEFSIGFVPHIVVFGVFAVCIFQQPDYGSVVILGTLTLLMMFVGGVRCTHLFWSIAALPAPVRAAMAGDSGKEVKLAGWITDEWCGKNNANKDGADCAKACAKKGAQLVLFSDGNIYKLSDQKSALEHVGHKVVVQGVMKDEETVEVRSIEQAEEDA